MARDKKIKKRKKINGEKKHYAKIIGTNIRKIRRKCNLAGKDIAEKLDLTNQYVNYMKRGERLITLVNLIELSQLFNVSLDFFGR